MKDNDGACSRSIYNTQLIKQLTDELEQALGILNPMVIEDLNKEIQEEHTDPDTYP